MKYPNLRDLLQDNDLVSVDGQPAVWYSRIPDSLFSCPGVPHVDPPNPITEGDRILMVIPLEDPYKVGLKRPECCVLRRDILESDVLPDWQGGWAVRLDSLFPRRRGACLRFFNSRGAVAPWANPWGIEKCSLSSRCCQMGFMSTNESAFLTHRTMERPLEDPDEEDDDV
jgi:hypothetical protein